MGRKICPLTHISIVATYAAIGVDGEENVSHSACKFNGCIRSPRGGWGGKCFQCGSWALIHSKK